MFYFLLIWLGLLQVFWQEIWGFKQLSLGSFLGSFLGI
jgi:hypothetical protein